MKISTSPARFSLLLLVMLALVFSSPSAPVSAVEKPAAEVLPAGLIPAAFLPLVGNGYYAGAISRDHYSWNLTGPNGGTTTAIAIDPHFPENLYTGTVGMGVFVSRNGGSSWQAYNIGLANRVIQSLATDAVNSGTVYAGTYGDGVFKSTDFGQTWHPTGPGLNDAPIVYSLAVHPTQPNILLAGTRSRGNVGGGGIYKSKDGGASWYQAWSNDIDWVYDIAFDPVDPSQVYLVSHAQSVFKSGNTGESWNNIGGANVPRNTRAVVVNPKNDLIAYVGSWGGDSNVMKTIDGGQNWSAAMSGIREKVLRLAIDPNNPDTVYACVVAGSGYTGGIYKTTDGGASWFLMGMYQATVNGAAVNPLDPNKVYAAAQPGGVFRSMDGGNSFYEDNFGLTTTTITSVAADPADRDRLYLATLDRGMFRSTDGGVNWQPINNGIPDGAYVLSITIDPTNRWALYAGTEANSLYRSVNGGDFWEPVNNGLIAMALPPTQTNPETASEDGTTIPLLVERLEKYQRSAPEITSWSVTSVLVNPADPQILYAGTPGGVYKSIDGAANWSSVGLGDYITYSLKFAPGLPTTIYAATNDGLYRSDNSGADWNQAGFPGARIYTLALADTNPRTILASVEWQGLWRSSDDGATWTLLSDGLFNQPVTALVVDPLDPMTVYAGTSNGGLFRSGNLGDFWASVDLSPFDQQINGLSFRPGSPVSLFGGSSLHGSFMINFYQRPLSALAYIPLVVGPRQ